MSPALVTPLLLVSLLSTPAAPPPDAASAPRQASATAPTSTPKRWTFFGSWRARQELWDWFGDEKGADRTTFTGSLLRLGVSYRDRKDDAVLELAQPLLLNLPEDASLLPPLGQLGHGASYRDANGGQEVSLFVKQAFWRRRGLGSPANSAQLGRFEFNDGLETSPADPSLAWLKRERISQRLIGAFGFTHVQRSFDGGMLVRNTPGLNITFLGAMPTEGVFDLDGGGTLDKVHLGYAAATVPLNRKSLHAEARLFGLYYDDTRSGVVKTDNRPVPLRLGDTDAVRIGTFGGHAAAVWERPCGKLDALAWGAGQFGKWGVQDHGAFAWDVEAGFQPRGLWGSPWFRAGFAHFSGDGSPANRRHGTFFPVLPTPRIYARFPFYTLANLNDGFVQALLRPHPRLTLRSDVHFLSLADRDDLWYAGGGAFQKAPSFGYAGRPSGGASYLATLYDLSADYRLGKETSATAYVGYAAPGKVIRSTFGSGGGLYTYLELTHRW